jgi:predicted nucleotidyltransferase
MLLNNKRIEMLQSFINNTNIKATASEIAKKRKLNQKSTSLFFKELEKQNILKSSTQGKNKLYFLNKESKLLIHFISIVENFITINFYKKHTKIKYLAEKILPKINNTAIIFGSYTKNKQKSGSDIDLLIIGDYDKSIEQDAELFNLTLDIKHYKELRKDTLVEEVKKNHIILKGFENFIQKNLENQI